MRMPGFSAEASLYKSDELFGLEDARTAKTDGMGIVPAQMIQYQIPTTYGPMRANCVLVANRGVLYKCCVDGCTVVAALHP